MARVLHQEFYRDPVAGLIGIHRIQFDSAAPASEAALTFPRFQNVSSVAVVGGTAGGQPIGDTVTASLTGLFNATICVDSETITVGGVIYTTRAGALATPATAYSFVGPAVAATKLANFINAVNGVADGVTVGTGTRPNPSVYAVATGVAGTVGIYARRAGTAGNAIIVAENCAGAIFAWTAGVTALAGGTGVVVGASVLTGTTNQIFFDGFSTGDVIDVVTGHGTSSLNYQA